MVLSVLPFLGVEFLTSRIVDWELEGKFYFQTVFKNPKTPIKRSEIKTVNLSISET